MQRGIQRLENQDREEQSLVRRSLFLSPSLARTGTTQCLCQKQFSIKVIRQISETNMKSVVLDRFWGTQTKEAGIKLIRDLGENVPAEYQLVWTESHIWDFYLISTREPPIFFFFLHWEFKMAIQRIILFFPSKKTCFFKSFLVSWRGDC